MNVKELIVALQKLDGEYQVDNVFKIGDEMHLRFSLEAIPKPKTALVELLMEDIEYWNTLGEFWRSGSDCRENGEYKIKSNNFFDACRKALENLK